ncbi:class II aldolase/adducin family protein [Bacteroidota bacterium]
MILKNLHPSEQITKILTRIYEFGMTTTSGGNVSLLDEEGNIWISPAGVDKGNLQPQDIVCISKNGKISGFREPSSEFPFHKAIYEIRPDINAVIHAHPPALVAFSIVRKIPDTCIIPQANHICGSVGYASYELPGSDKLGESIAKAYKENHDVVIMENHGVVVGGSDLSMAYQKFETLEFCAKSTIEASAVGSIKSLDDEQINLFYERKRDFPEFVRVETKSHELKLRGDLFRMVERAYKQRLIISTYGTFSVRVGENDFLITPYGKDRYYITREDIVLIKEGKRERGKVPSRSSLLHYRLYQDHPEINSIITAQSPFIMAYCVTGQTFDTRTIPESYIMLRDIPLIPYGDQYREGSEVTSIIGKDTPIVLLENDSIMVTGSSLLETFDRLEVAEFTARSVTRSRPLGDMIAITDNEVNELRKKFID